MKFIKKRIKDDYSYEDDFFVDGDYYGGNQEKEPEVNSGEDTYDAGKIGVSFAGSSSPVALKVVKPKSFDEAPAIADYIGEGSTVLLNIENMDRNSTKRMLDFLMGATHVLGGTMNMVTGDTFVFAPKTVGVADVSAEEEIEDETNEEQFESEDTPVID